MGIAGFKGQGKIHVGPKLLQYNTVRGYLLLMNKKKELEKLEKEKKSSREVKL